MFPLAASCQTVIRIHKDNHSPTPLPLPPALRRTKINCAPAVPQRTCWMVLEIVKHLWKYVRIGARSFSTAATVRQLLDIFLSRRDRDTARPSCVIGHPGPTTPLHFGAFCVALCRSQEVLCCGKSQVEEHKRELQVHWMHKCSLELRGAYCVPAVVVRLLNLLSICSERPYSKLSEL